MSKIDLITQEMLDIASPQMKKVVSYRKEHSLQETAKHFKLDPSVVCAYVSRLLKRCVEEEGMVTGLPKMTIADGKRLGKMTTQIDGKGEVKNIWYRQDKDTQKQLETIQAISAELLSEIKPRKKVPFPSRNTKDELMVNIPIGDAHIGMLAWGEESGADYDLQIAADVHKRAVDMLVEQTPDARYCTIIDLGDYLHSDNMEGMTSRSGHSLDMDGRYHKVVRVAISIALYYIDKALEKFEHVIYRAEMGNHNDIGSIWMQELLHRLYKDEPRVTIGNKAGVTFFWQHGDCYFMSHHGHQIKGNRLSELFARQIMDNDITTKHRKIYLGHVHHKSFTENAICEVQTYRTLAAKDAYAAGYGYHAGRSISAEVWHKQYGEMSTVNVTIPMLEDAL